MMKRVSSSSSAKPISASSPGRAVDKFPSPAPLMRFLRSNAGSRSGGRARSRGASPMFVRKKSLNLRHRTSTKTRAAAEAAATQEPSSPKVTCMGQVRVRRSSSSKQSTTSRRRKNPSPADSNRCRWVPTPDLCGRVVKFKSFSLRPQFENWPAFFRTRRNKDESFKNKNGPVSISVRGEENGSSFHTNFYEDKQEDDNQNKEEVDCSSSSPAPPINALLLTRCRSAPYRSSSLACRFWGSPLSNSTAEAQETAEEQKTNDQADEEDNGGELEDSASSIDDDHHDPPPVECLKVIAGEVDRPTINVMVLTRCKSEPARTGQKLLDPEGIFWRQRKVGDHDDGNGLIKESKSEQVCD